MADDADSKSVVGNHVRVQVPLPALKEIFIMKISFLHKAKFGFVDLDFSYSKADDTG